MTKCKIVQKPELKVNKTNEFTIQISCIKTQDGLATTKLVRRCKPSDCCVVFGTLSCFIYVGLVVWAVLIWLHPDYRNNNVCNKIYMDSKINDLNPSSSDCFQIVPRLNWLAQPPTEPIASLRTPVSLIIIHHTATEPCSTKPQCVFQTRLIQQFHVESRGWSDIGYNFLIGGDKNIYEGRNWTGRGAHTLGYNNKSLGVAFIGTFDKEVPTESQIHALNVLIDKGFQLGYLTDDFKIMAASQFSNTSSPGRAFFDDIKMWNHWSKTIN